MTKQKSRLKVSGMICVTCPQTIEKALLETEGVDKALVSFAAETPHIEYDDKITNEKKLTEIVKDTGYNVDGGTQRITLRIRGMTRASCAQTIENALRETEGMHAKTWRRG